MIWYKYIPNLVTLLNLAIGFMAILINDPLSSPLLILIAAVLDLADGLLARLLNAQSALGGQLDSFADLISFGAAPAFLYYHHLMQGHWYEMLLLSLFPVMGALRLAKFNLSHQTGESFKGLPIPGAGLLLAFVVYGLSSEEALHLDHLILALIPLGAGILMLSSWRMMSFKKIREKTKTEQYFIVILVLLSLALVLYFHLGGIALVVLLYLVLSFLYKLLNIRKRS